MVVCYNNTNLAAEYPYSQSTKLINLFNDKLLNKKLELLNNFISFIQYLYY